jgi:hypothetical protein
MYHFYNPQRRGSEAVQACQKLHSWNPVRQLILAFNGNNQNFSCNEMLLPLTRMNLQNKVMVNDEVLNTQHCLDF